MLVQFIGLCQLWVLDSREVLMIVASCMTDSCIAVVHHALPLRVIGASTQGWEAFGVVFTDKAQHVQGCQHLPLNDDALVELYRISHCWQEVDFAWGFDDPVGTHLDTRY